MLSVEGENSKRHEDINRNAGMTFNMLLIKNIVDIVD